MQNTINFLLAILYALIGLCMAVAGIETLRDKANKARIGTAVFGSSWQLFLPLEIGFQLLYRVRWF